MIPKYKLGDAVICIDSGNTSSNGAGWKDGKKFIVDLVKQAGNDYDFCYFPKDGSGVYEHALELVIISWKQRYQ
jgi:hypothetical protein